MMNYTVTKNNKMVAIGLMVLGILSIAYGFSTGDTTRSWANLLIGNFYFMAMALGATFFLAVQYVAEVGWSVQIKRVWMAMGQYLPFAGLFMILIFAFGHHDLYSWTHAENYDKTSEHYDAILDGKSGYLNMTFYFIRLVLYAVIWAGFAFLLRKESLKEDEVGGYTHYHKASRLSAIFLVLFAITSSTSAWDILMSVDAHWFSTLFGWYTFAGLFVTTMTVTTMIVLYLKRKGYLPNVNDNHIHDLGKFMFAFSIFWTYLWFSQFMLIWYANLPEEVVYFMQRQGHYKPLFLANVIINFAVPFIVLMTRDAKRMNGLLTFVGCVIVAGHWLDVYMMVMPGTVGEHGSIGIQEIGTPCFFAGLFMWVVFHKLAAAPLIPKNHPMIKESYYHHI